MLDTHWDNASESSRVSSAELTRARLPELADGRAVVLTDDLNTTEDGEAFTTLLGDDGELPVLIDAYRQARPVRRDNEATFHGFDGGRQGSRIDFILHDDALRTLQARIVRDDIEGAYASDHFPVTATLAWRAADDGTACPE